MHLLKSICRGQILNSLIVRMLALSVDYDYFACTPNMIRYKHLGKNFLINLDLDTFNTPLKLKVDA